MKKLMLAGAVAALAFGGCTHTEKVSVKQPGDANLTCAQIESEFNDLDSVMNEARDNKGVNTANVAAVLFFWPAAVGNYMDADKAEDLVKERRAHLTEIYEEKGC